MLSLVRKLRLSSDGLSNPGSRSVKRSQTYGKDPARGEQKRLALCENIYLRLSAFLIDEEKAYRVSLKDGLLPISLN